MATWVTKYDETFGRCYSMELSSAVTAKGIINVVFVSRISIYVYLHHPAQKMDVDSKTKVSHPEMKEDPGIEPGTDRGRIEKKKDRNPLLLQFRPNCSPTARKKPAATR